MKFDYRKIKKAFKKTSFRKIINNFVTNLMVKDSKINVHVENKTPFIKDDNCIYVCNHLCGKDIPSISKAIENHSYVLVGKQKFRLKDKVGLFLKGVIYFDRQKKKEKQRAKEKIINKINKNNNIIIFIEGTWSFSRTKLLMDKVYWGVVDIARRTKKPIIVSALVYDLEYKNCYVKFLDKPIYVNDKTNNEVIDEIYENLKGLIYQLMEKKCQYKRDEIETFLLKQESYRQESTLSDALSKYDFEKRLKDYHVFNFFDEMAAVRDAKVLRKRKVDNRYE